MTLSQSQLRLVSNIGVGILVGTSMIVIIPEGLSALVPSSAATHGHSHLRARELGPALGLSARAGLGLVGAQGIATVSADVEPRRPRGDGDNTEGEGQSSVGDEVGNGPEGSTVNAPPESMHEGGTELPTFFIGFSMVSGFILMFLIDRIPKHANATRAANEPREVRLDSLGMSSSPQGGDEESERFLGSESEGSQQSRSVSTTTGLVIHAAADGIAMGASSSTSNARLGFIVFVAIMIHKAPAAFGLTSVLLRQGLSKRAARGHLLVFSLASPAGAVATWFLIALLGGSKMDGDDGQWWTGNLLLFSAGTFL